jgi:hypothetical protein
MDLAFWEIRCTTCPFFEPCPYTWKGKIFHSLWNLEISFFPLLFAKIRIPQVLHINNWDFCLVNK